MVSSRWSRPTFQMFVLRPSSGRLMTSVANTSVIIFTINNATHCDNIFYAITVDMSQFVKICKIIKYFPQQVTQKNVDNIQYLATNRIDLPSITKAVHV
jgi:hypothetical protein